MQVERHWDSRSPIQLYYWSDQWENGMKPDAKFRLLAVMTVSNGEIFAYDMRAPTSPRFIGRYPSGGDDWKAKLEFAREQVEADMYNGVVMD